MPEPLTRHQILLFEGDFERLREFYTLRSPTDVVRTLVRKHLEQLDAQLTRNKELNDA